jgi:hypothetical protein
MAVAAAAPSATPLAGEHVHPRVCASPSSGFATTPLGGGRSERIQRAGKVGYSEALPGTRCLRQRWIRCGGTLGRLLSHHKRRPGALPVSGVYRRSGMADEVRLTALRSSSRSFLSISGDEVSPDALTVRVRVSAQISYLYLILILIWAEHSSPSQCCGD